MLACYSNKTSRRKKTIFCKIVETYRIWKGKKMWLDLRAEVVKSSQQNGIFQDFIGLLTENSEKPSLLENIAKKSSDEYRQILQWISDICPEYV